jgi:hypothetical protein
VSDDQLEIGTLLDSIPKGKVDKPVPLLTERKVDTIARFLAGFGFPAQHSYERLTKAQQRTAREAAAAALTVFDKHREDN